MTIAAFAAVTFASCIAQSENKCVKPLPASVNIADIKDATVPAEFTSDDFNWMGSNLSMTVYEEDIYDAAEICFLAKGDTLIWNGDTLIVNEIEQRGGTKIINKGIEEGGAELVSNGGGTFRGTSFNDHSTYTKLGKVTLPLSDNFTIIDCGEEPSAPSDTISSGQKLYLEGLKDYRRTFTMLNTRVLIENGVVTNITRHWIP